MSNEKTAQRLMELFRGHERVHGTHGVPTLKPNSLKWEIKSTATTHREPPTLELWMLHVEGKRPLGIVPIREDASCSWGSIDVDEYDVNLLSIIQSVERLGLPLVPCRSKSGGLHLFLFLAEPQSAAVVQSVLRDLAAQLGKAGSEIFPKQTQILAERGDQGNWMVMPYFGSTYGGKIKEQVGLRKTGAELTAEEFCSLAEKSRVSSDALVVLGQKKAPRARATGTGAAPGTPFADGPPCLQHLASEGVSPGGQSNALLMMGIYYKRMDPHNWKKLLEAANSTHLRPPGSAEGLTSVVRSLERKDYEYTCKAEPMVSHCNSSLCRTRKHGVGGGGLFPVINSLSKLDTDPAVWFVDIEGVRLVATTDQLVSYPKFHALCVEKVHVSYMMMKIPDWLSLLGDALNKMTVIPAPEEASTAGRFLELLTEFLTNRARGERREDLLSGRPFEEEGRHYFRLKDLQKFLRREDMKELPRGMIVSHLRDLGGDRYQFAVKGHNVSCYWVPGDKVAAPPSIDPLPPKGSPI